MAKRQKQGLVMRGVSLDVEFTTARHKLPCFACGKVIPVGSKRTKFQLGSGRHAKSYVLCLAHAAEAMRELEDCVEAARKFLISSREQPRENIRFDLTGLFDDRDSIG